MRLFTVLIRIGGVASLVAAANRFAPHLLKSVEMAKFVDEKIKP